MALHAPHQPNPSGHGAREGGIRAILNVSFVHALAAVLRPGLVHRNPAQQQTGRNPISRHGWRHNFRLVGWRPRVPSVVSVRGRAYPAHTLQYAPPASSHASHATTAASSSGSSWPGCLHDPRMHVTDELAVVNSERVMCL